MAAAKEEFGFEKGTVRGIVKKACHVLETAPASKYKYRVWNRFINAFIRNEAVKIGPQRSRPSEFKEGRIEGI